MRSSLREVILILVCCLVAGCPSGQPSRSTGNEQGKAPAPSRQVRPDLPPGSVASPPADIPEKTLAPTAPGVNEASAGAPAPGGVPEIELVRKTRTGSLPKAVVPTPDGKTLFVTNFGRVTRWNVFAYDATSLERRGVVEFAGNGVEMAFSPDGTRLYVSNFRKHLVLEIDPEKLEVLRTFPVGKNPKTLVVSPDGSRVYVSNWSSDTVTAIDVHSGEVLGHIRTGNQPRGIDVSPDGRFLYVSNCAGNTVTMVDTQKLQAVKTIRLKKRAPTKPRHVKVSPDGKLVYVTAQAVGFLYALDAATMEIMGKARTGSGPKTVDITSDGRWAFTANFTGDSITTINLSTYESRNVHEPVVREPCGLAVSPDDRKLYVTGWHATFLGEYEVTYPTQWPHTDE